MLESLSPPDGTPCGPVLDEVTALYASNRAFFELSGDFPDPARITSGQVARALAAELAQPGAEVLLARCGGRLVGLAATLAHHPDPAAGDPDPWIGLLLIEAGAHRRGHGRALAGRVEDRFRAAGRDGVRLAVLDDNPGGLAFWRAQGYAFLRHARDLERGRACTVLRKPLA
ncbi:GNAT family N-acetyltransferase [Streptomyces antimicrobicus]|uniref:GNAT family N-acetyltransferase n=1 Tax=Streptomyces antimicrobicus TaxID=2883108 RepID=A0ABS8B2N8_9ACTN|nr:GNAT family N-acetyltransferase [Streptomyces antimicrobicus]MCB5178865.1 GNAT family N-acetyltransferase [Streptomyces antimicrobicus]